MKPEFDFDGVHPNKDGYLVMGKSAAEVIKGVLKVET